MSRSARENALSMEMDDPIFGESTYHCNIWVKVKTNVKDHQVWTIRSLKDCDWFWNSTSAKICEHNQPGEATRTEKIDTYIGDLTAAIATSLHDSCPIQKFRTGFSCSSPDFDDWICLKHKLQREIKQHPDYLQLWQAHHQLIKEIKTWQAEERHNQVQPKNMSLDAKQHLLEGPETTERGQQAHPHHLPVPRTGKKIKKNYSTPANRH